MAKRQSLALKLKLDIINKYEQGYSNNQLSSEYKVHHSTISSIIKNKSSYKEKVRVYSNTLKKVRSPLHENLEKGVRIFCDQTIASKVPLSGAIIRQKALSLAEKLGIVDFKASNGWLSKFTKRNLLKYKVVSGESASVDMEQAGSFMANLSSIIKDYDPSDIFNMDETGLFFKCLPNKTFHRKNEKCHGGKSSKERITVALTTNMTGTEKLPPLVIGKSTKPRCFKNVKSLPVVYRNNAKSWMTSTLFEEFVLQWDRSLEMQNRKIILFIDNCPAHPQVQQKLTNINLKFFPPNATSVLQPLDLGIIKSFKSHYRNKLVQRKLNEVENQNSVSSISLLESINLLSEAWYSDVKQSTIVNCFVKAGFVKPDCVIMVNDEGMDEINTDFDQLDGVRFETFEDFVNFDNELVTCETLSDDDIVGILNQDENSLADVTECSEESVEYASTPATKQDLVNACDMLHKHLLYMENIPCEYFSSLLSIKTVFNERYMY